MDRIVYTIPGLGFDQRIFQNLSLNAKQVVHLNWIEPLPKENIKSYAERMGANIENTFQNCALIGHSFGGIMGQEIANIFPVQKIIIVSSIKSPEEKPVNFKTIGKLGLHRYFSKKLTETTFKYWANNFGYDTPELKNLFLDMVGKHSDQYLQWALMSLSNWQGTHKLKMPLIHIHGEKDKTFPIHHIKQPVQKVEHGSHVMVYDKPQQVSNLINKALLD